MTGLYILAGIIIFFLVLMSVSADVRVIYSSAEAESLNIYIQIGIFKLRIIPAGQKKVNRLFEFFKRRQRKKIKKAAKEKKEPEKERYTISGILRISKELGLVLFEKSKKYLKIRIYRLYIRAGSEDAFKTSKLYADINQAAYYIYEILKNNFKFKADNINIYPDFLSERTDFGLDLKISVTLGAGLNILISEAMAFLKFRAENSAKNIKKQERGNKNGGQQPEQAG
ncbi:MAG: DUF2953 domain-containing protein [Oscillospiraceae bacterium]|nr:DUF2953 domain-containing protein [Oscillospiraceae bacterium]